MPTTPERHTAMPPQAAFTMAVLAMWVASAPAQAGIGSIKTSGVEVAGNVSVRDGRAAIGTNAAVTAGTQSAEVALNRGGSVKICTGSSMHLSMSTAALSAAIKRPPIMVALDRGSIEIHTAAEKTDAILTPDMRLELSDGAPLDLHIRVIPNGDTCVENTGKNAPVLHVTQTFGNGTYFIRPGQRVLFEHGSLREVVDHESSSCGCPGGDGLVLAGKGKKGDGKIPETARTNPFPEAVSQGLSAPAVPQATPGEQHTQVSSTLAYNGATNTVSGPPGQSTTLADVPVTVGGAASSGTLASDAPASAPTPANSLPAATTSASTATDTHIESAAPPPAGPNPFRAIGRFFKRLLGGH